MQLEQNYPNHTNILVRFWIYQRERFPVLAHGLLIAVFSFSAIGFSALLRGQNQLPGFGSSLVGFGSAFLFFLQLRLADEFKDYEEDARYRPYRPVPRGVVTLRELGLVGVLTVGIQLGLALWLEPALVLPLVLVWGYLGLMSREFFVRAWLKARPLLYLASHMLIVPLIAFYTSAYDWRVVGETMPPQGLIWFLIVSFFNGMVIELGRKIRAPQAEEPGVETYSFLWGHRRAVLVWLGVLLVTASSAWLAAAEIGFAGPITWLLGGLLGIAAGLVIYFLYNPVTASAKLIEVMSGLWTLLLYLGLGVGPLLILK